MTLTVYDYDNKAVDIEIPAKNIEEIELITVVVLSGDETGTIFLTNGNRIDFDASDCRFQSFYDGDYIVKGTEQIKKWIDFQPSQGRTYSYQRQNLFE